MANQNQVETVETKTETIMPTETKTESKSQKQRREAQEKKKQAGNKKVAKGESETLTIYGLGQQLAGRKLFAFTCGLLTVLGLMRSNARSFTAPSSVMRRMYATPTAFTYHRQRGNIEEPEQGMFRLTKNGYNHFVHGRVNGKNPAQDITDEMLQDAIQFIRHGKAEGIFKGIIPNKVTIPGNLKLFDK